MLSSFHPIDPIDLTNCRCFTQNFPPQLRKKSLIKRVTKTEPLDFGGLPNERYQNQIGQTTRDYQRTTTNVPPTSSDNGFQIQTKNKTITSTRSSTIRCCAALPLYCYCYQICYQTVTTPITTRTPTCHESTYYHLPT